MSLYRQPFRPPPLLPTPTLSPSFSPAADAHLREALRLIHCSRYHVPLALHVRLIKPADPSAHADARAPSACAATHIPGVVLLLHPPEDIDLVDLALTVVNEAVFLIPADSHPLGFPHVCLRCARPAGEAFDALADWERSCRRHLTDARPAERAA